ncbi:MAG: DUF3325 family protein [Xylophilus ampelinus]
MSGAWLAAGAFSGSLAAMAAFGLAMDRHFEDVFGRGRAPGRWRLPLRAAGVACLAAGLLASLALQGRAAGWVLWLGALTAAALATAAALSYVPRAVPWIAGGGAAVLLLAGGGALAGG